MPSGSSQRNRSILTQQTLEESFGDININVDEQANDLVRYIINRAGEHMAFKRAELKKNVLPKAGQLFQDIVTNATKILRDVYGYNMIVVDASKNAGKEYIVSNILPYIYDPTEKNNEEEIPKDVHKILLLLILSHIFMSNNSVSEVSLYTFLKSLQIDVEKRHEIFGNVRDYINHTLKNKSI
ncbi:hypothetical protein NQ317_012523 [Molorchus minor]|uniref:MAGE domain-containing protein n=1 Tax=Molorchus minor TaxID=1323400 RepID=A0ABQ9K4F5_9CUCU|nr:hypothetical protein NQ317_012523 [Molorchus minor]